MATHNESNSQQLLRDGHEAAGQTQRGEQVKNTAQGAADAVKNTLRMNNASNSPTDAAGSNPYNPSEATDSSPATQPAAAAAAGGAAAEGAATAAAF